MKSSNFDFNLFHENRLVFMAEGPRKAPDAPNTGSTEHLKKMTPEQANEAQKVAIDKVGRVYQAISAEIKKDPNNKKLREIADKLVNLGDKLDKFHEHMDGGKKEFAKAVGETIASINNIIDQHLPEVRDKLIGSSLNILKEKGTRGQKWGDSLVTAFSIMKIKDRVQDGDLTLKRDGNKLFVQYKKESYEYNLSTDGTEWKIRDHAGNDVALNHNPLYGLNDGERDSKLFRVGSKKAEAPAPKAEEPKAAPKKAEKPMEAVEKDGTAKVAECLKFIHEAHGATQDIPNDLFKALQSFIKDIAKDSQKSFEHGDVKAYVTRSKDGKTYRISTEIGNSKLAQYLAKDGKAIGTLPRKAVFKSDRISSQIKDIEEGLISGKLKNDPVKNNKPKTVDTNEPNPTEADRRRLGLINENKEFSSDAKQWMKKLDQTLVKLVDTFRTFPSKVMDIAKAIIANNPDQYQTQENRNGLYKKVSNLPTNLGNLSSSLKSKTPKEASDSLKGILSRVPDGEKVFASKYGITAFEGNLYASLDTSTLPGKEAARVTRDAAPITQGKKVVSYDLTDKPEVIKGNVKSYDFTEKPEVIKGNLKSYNLGGEDEVIYGKIDNPLVRKEASTNISKIIDQNTFVLRDVANLKIHQILDLPEGKSVSIQIKRKNGEIVNAVYDSEGKDKTYHITSPEKEEGKRVKIYDGDTLTIKSVNSYAPDKEVAKGKKDKRVVAEYDLTGDEQGRINARESTVDNNRNELIKRLRTLKPGEGISFTTNEGKIINVYKAKNEKGYYSVDENGKRGKFGMTDVMTYSQLMAKDPDFRKTA